MHRITTALPVLLILPLTPGAGMPARDGVDHCYELAAKLGGARHR